VHQAMIDDFSGRSSAQQDSKGVITKVLTEIGH
jgi:hypothetical protein